MTPHSFTPDDGPFVFRLSQACGTRGEPLVGRCDLNSGAAYRAAEVLVRKIKHDVGTDESFRRRFVLPLKYRKSLEDCELLCKPQEMSLRLPSDNNVLHENKMTHVLRDTLLGHNLAAYIDREHGWLVVHPVLANAFMSCAAAAVAKENGLEIVTDKGTIHDSVATCETSAIYDAIVHGGGTASKGRAINTRLAQLVILNNFDLDALSAEDLIAMSREEDALYDFRQKVATAAQNIPEMESEAKLESELKHHANRLFEEWNSSRSNMSAFAKRFFGVELAKEGKVEKIVETFAAYGGGATLGAHLLGLAPGLALALVVRGATVWSGMKKKQKGGQLRYLTLLEGRTRAQNKRLANWSATFVSAGL